MLHIKNSALGRYLGEFGSGITNDSFNLKLHKTTSLLSSATLLGNFIRNWHIRNFETNSSVNNRKIINIANEKHPIWEGILNQKKRSCQIESAIKRLEFIKKISEFIQKLDSHSDSVEDRGSFKDFQKISQIRSLMKDNITLNIHPDKNTAKDLCIDGKDWKVRGICMKICGSRSGNRSAKILKFAGKWSTNSVGLVHKDTCNIQLPGKMGVNGLKIIMVYDLCRNSLQPNSLLWNGTSYFRPFL